MKPVTPGHRILVKPDSLETYDPQIASAKKHGIIMLEADERKERTGVDTGVVVQIGPTAFKDFGGERWCNEGDRISYARHAGKFIKNPETKEEWLCINDEDVVMVWEN